MSNGTLELVQYKVDGTTWLCKYDDPRACFNTFLECFSLDIRACLLGCPELSSLSRTILEFANDYCILCISDFNNIMIYPK